MTTLHRFLIGLAFTAVALAPVSGAAGAGAAPGRASTPDSAEAAGGLLIQQIDTYSTRVSLAAAEGDGGALVVKGTVTDSRSGDSLLVWAYQPAALILPPASACSPTPRKLWSWRGA